ncbi:glycosyltransferase family 2 protein [Lysobacter sp. N42]|uniref:glycosyltransferase family 2 protein n=1 Tax=Lysobacter sp. N42 TaxID=2545719 RepID=UPI001049376A|nr:glycosyltransferase family 2 protein [Lysobacter sp. N42]TCZ84337.1 glycosyltransferase family 2 protein [Lysobacter sp. N42]
MDETPWLSLLLPVYNVDGYVEDCVSSILAQEAAGIEILLLDDASTDSSAQAIERCVAADPGRVRAFRHPHNRGLSAARNTLLEQARGRHVWFVDSDDLVLPGALAALRAVIDAGQPDLVLCDFAVVRERFGLKHRLRGELHRRTFRGPAGRVLDDRSTLVEGLLLGGQLHTWSKIARREVWAAAPFPEGRYYEDIAVIAPLVAATRSWTYLPRPMVGYRQREGSIMRTVAPGRHLHLQRSIAELHDGLMAMRAQLTPAALFAIDYFCLRTYASTARRLVRARDAAAGTHEDWRQGLLGLFPGGVDGVINGCRRRGWPLRAWRARYYLRRAGWTGA